MNTADRLIILLLTDLIKGLNVESELDPDLIARLVYENATWALPYAYQCLGDDDETGTEQIKETQNILTMWGAIENNVRRLNFPSGNNLHNFQHTHFPGFDGNEGPHHAITRVFINELSLFQNLADYPLNNHGGVDIDYHLEVLKRYNEHKTAVLQNGASAAIIHYILN